MVRVERKGSIALLFLEHAPANALDLEFGAAIEAAFAPLARDATVGAVVLTGEGRFFSAGVDLKRIPTYGPDAQAAMVTMINRLLLTLYGFPLPVIAAVNGHAIAGGLVIALATDHRLGAEGTYQLGLTETAAGIPYPVAAMEIVRAELTPPVCRRLVLRADNTNPSAALAAGIVDELVAPAQLMPRALEVAEGFAKLPRDAYGRVKRQLRAPVLERIAAVLARGDDPMLAGWLSTETAGAAAGLLARVTERR